MIGKASFLLYTTDSKCSRLDADSIASCDRFFRLRSNDAHVTSFSARHFPKSFSTRLLNLEIFFFTSRICLSLCSVFTEMSSVISDSDLENSVWLYT